MVMALLGLVAAWGLIARTRWPWTAQVCWGLMALNGVIKVFIAVGVLVLSPRGLPWPTILARGIIGYMAVTLGWGRAGAVAVGALMTFGLLWMAPNPWGRWSQGVWFVLLGLWMSQPVWSQATRTRVVE